MKIKVGTLVSSCCTSSSSTSIRYEISVKTGNRKRAGTDSLVKIQFIGKTAQTSPTKLDVRFRNDFECGRDDKFIVKMEDIKVPVICKLR